MNPLITVFSIISIGVIGTISFSVIDLYNQATVDEQVISIQNILESTPKACFTVINSQTNKVQEIVVYDQMSIYIRENIPRAGLSENEFYGSPKYDEYFERQCLAYVTDDGYVPDHYDPLLSVGLTLSQSSLEEILEFHRNSENLVTFLGDLE